MPRVRITVCVLVASLFAAAPARAGLYYTEEPPRVFKIPREGVQSMRPELFRQNVLADLRRIAINMLNNQPREEYEKRRKELERKRRQGRFTIEDRINLSYYLIRLNLLDEALQLLRDEEAQRSGHFMIFANLATVYEMLANGGTPADRKANLMQALTSLSIMRQTWPKKDWPGWSKEQIQWYKEAEAANRALVLERLGEAATEAERTPGGSDRPFSSVDELFPLNFKKDGKKPVAFVAEDGDYQAGKIAPAEKAKLTDKDLKLVQQLVFWLPRDDRLYWLWGELLNAQGDRKSVETAAAALNDLYTSRNLTNIPLLRDHRNILQEATAPPLPKSWLPSGWQLVLVGGGGALVIALLAYLQIREIRRRRLRSSTGREEVAP